MNKFQTRDLFQSCLTSLSESIFIVLYIDLFIKKKRGLKRTIITLLSLIRNINFPNVQFYCINDVKAPHELDFQLPILNSSDDIIWFKQYQSSNVIKVYNLKVFFHNSQL
jgi:hypothetical protein